MSLTVSAGQRLTASMLNAFVPLYLTQASDQALATTTFTGHNLFTAVPISVGTTWFVDCYLAHNSADAGNDIKVRWAVTGGAAIVGYRHIVSLGLSSTGVDGTTNVQARGLTDSVSGGSSTSGTVFASWRESFMITASGTDGTYGLEWAQASAVTGVTTVKAGSFLIARRVA